MPTVGGMGVPWRGRVTRTAGEIVYVEIPLYAPGKEFACEDYSTALIEGTAAGAGAVTGNIKPLQQGDRVVVQFWGPDDPVVVSRKV